MKMFICTNKGKSEEILLGAGDLSELRRMVCAEHAYFKILSLDQASTVGAQLCISLILHQNPILKSINFQFCGTRGSLSFYCCVTFLLQTTRIVSGDYWSNEFILYAGHPLRIIRLPANMDAICWGKATKA